VVCTDIPGLSKEKKQIPGFFKDSKVVTQMLVDAIDNTSKGVKIDCISTKHPMVS